MAPRLSHVYQGDSVSCGIGVWEIFLRSCGVDIPEAELRSLLETKAEGTDLANMIRLADLLRVDKVVGANGTPEQLNQLLERDYRIMICYMLLNDTGYYDTDHYAFFKGSSNRNVHLCDPLRGPNCKYSLEEFMRRWQTDPNGSPSDPKINRWYMALRLNPQLAHPLLMQNYPVPAQSPSL